jgi:hypothetical protein
MGARSGTTRRTDRAQASLLGAGYVPNAGPEVKGRGAPLRPSHVPGERRRRQPLSSREDLQLISPLCEPHLRLQSWGGPGRSE